MAIGAVTIEMVQAAAAAPSDVAAQMALFAYLAAGKAAVRAKAAQNLIERFGGDRRLRGGLARDFGSTPNAVFTPLLAELREATGSVSSEAWARFIDSTVIGQDQWRDGIGYDLEALAAMTDEERGIIRQLLRTRLTDGNHNIDWRELEAAAALGDTELLEFLKTHSDSAIRLRVSRLLGDSGSTEDEICRALSKDSGSVSKALDLVSGHPTEKVKKALLARVRKVDDHFISAATVLLEVFGGVDDGWAERPFLFRVQEEGAGGPLMKELLQRAKSR